MAYVNSASSHAAFGGAERLDFIIGAVNMATPGIAAVSAGFANLTSVGMRTAEAISSAMTTATAGLMAAGGVAALVLAGATVEAAKFEKQLKMIQAVSGDLTDNELYRMGDQIKNLAMEYGVAADDIAKAMQVIGRAGLTDPSAQMAVFTDAMKIAKIEGMDLTTAIEELIQVTTMFGGSMDDPANFAKRANETAKNLVHASQISPTTVQDLFMGLKYVGGTADVSRMGQKDILAALSYMATKGVSGETAGTSLRGFISKQALSQPEVLNSLKSIGLTPNDLWTDGGNKAKPIWEQIKIINDKMESSGLSQMEKIGLWAKVAMQKTSQQLLKVDPEGMKQYYAKMQEQFDLDAKVAKAMDSAVEQFNRLKASIEVTLINVGEKSLVVLRPVIEGLQQFFEWIAKSNVAGATLAILLGTLAVAGAIVVARWAVVAGKYIYESFTMGAQAITTLSGMVTGFSGTVDKSGKAYATMAAGQKINADSLTISTAKQTDAILVQKGAIDQATASWYAYAQAAGISQSIVSPTMFTRPMSEAELAGLYSARLGRNVTPGGIGDARADIIKKNAKNSQEFGKLERDYALAQLKKADEETLTAMKAEMSTLEKTMAMDTALTGSAYGMTYGSNSEKAQKTRMQKLKDSIFPKKGALKKETVKWSKEEANIVNKLIREADEDVIASVAPFKTDTRDWKKSGLAERGVISMAKTGPMPGSPIAGEAAMAGSTLLGLPFSVALPAIAALVAGAILLYSWIKKQEKAIEDATKKLEAQNKAVEDQKAEWEKAYDAWANGGKTRTLKVKLELEEGELNKLLNQYAVTNQGVFDAKSNHPAYTAAWRDNKDYLIAQNFGTMEGYEYWNAPYGMNKWANAPEYQRFTTATPLLEKLYDMQSSIKGESPAKQAEYKESKAYKETLFELKKIYGDNTEAIQANVDWLIIEEKRKKIAARETAIWVKVLEHLFMPWKAFSNTTKQTDKNTDALKNNAGAQNESTSALERALNSQLVWIAKMQRFVDVVDYTFVSISVMFSATKATALGAVQAIDNAFVDLFNKFAGFVGLPAMQKLQIWTPQDQAGLDAQRAYLKSKEPKPWEYYYQKEKAAMDKEMEAFGFNTDITGLLGEDKGANGGSGSGSGSGTESGKERLLKDGYNIDFILCSKKRLPDLDPDTFKKKAQIELKTKKFQIDNIHINTRDKPENINKGIRQAIVDIAESDRV